MSQDFDCVIYSIWASSPPDGDKTTGRTLTAVKCGLGVASFYTARLPKFYNVKLMAKVFKAGSFVSMVGLEKPVI